MNCYISLKCVQYFLVQKNLKQLFNTLLFNKQLFNTQQY